MKGHKKKKKRLIKSSTIMIWALVILFVGLIVYQGYRNTKPAENDLEYTEFMSLLDNNKIESANIIKSQDTVTIKTTDGEKYNIVNPNYETFRKELLEAGVQLEVRKETVTDVVSSVVELVPMMVLSVLLVSMLSKTFGGQTSNLFEMYKPEEVITFDNVAGMTETKEEVKFAVSQLKNRDKLVELGTRPCKGIILEGPPGTGKTLLAKAIAGEADAKFISTSGADFIEMFAGLGAARVRSLWELAELNAPCVVFIDEIDAIGGKRVSSTNGAMAENNQTLNALLQRMDGLGSNPGIFVVAATNRISDLDPALLRPGRFDKKLYVGPPRTKQDRDEIIKLYLNKKKVADNLDFDTVSKLMFGMTGAEIEQCLNEAVLISVQKGLDGEISLLEIDEATMKLRASGVLVKNTSESDRRTAAIHEAGHAVVSMALGIKVSKVSIMPYSSGVGGFTIRDVDELDKKRFRTKGDMLNEIKVLFGGMEAERLILGDTSNGCSNDIDVASKVAFGIVNDYAMCDDSIINIRSIMELEKGLVGTQESIKRANGIMLECRNSTYKILEENKESIERITEMLLEKEVVLGDEISL